MPSQQSNNSFEGLWQKGLRSGYGTFNFASGAQYKGPWSENIKHGEGRYTYEDGRVYTGEFVMDNMAKDSTASEIPAEASTTQFLNVGGAENPVRRCIEINDLTGSQIAIAIRGCHSCSGSRPGSVWVDPGWGSFRGPYERTRDTRTTPFVNTGPLGP